MVLTDTGLAKVFQRIKSFVIAQLNSKASAIHTHTKSEITDFPTNYVTTDTTQTVAGNKEFTGTTTAHDLVPSATDTYNLGGPSYQWNNAYIKSLTINGVACGNILTHNASEFVDVTGAQTIAGVKTFSKIALKSSRIERGALPSSNITEDNEIEILDKNDRRILGIFNYYYTDGRGRTSFYAYNSNTTDYDNIAIAFDFDNANNQKSLLPVASNVVNLGSSTNKWKSFNGINPGALSLPSVTRVKVDTTNFVWDGVTQNIIEPPIPCIIYILVTASKIVENGTISAGNTVMYTSSQIIKNNVSNCGSNNNYAIASVQANAGDRVVIRLSLSSSLSGSDGVFYRPLLGNV